MPKFSKASLDQLATCHPSLQLLFNEVIKDIDCKVLEGHRGKEAQNKAYAEKRSKLKWPNGKHNKFPSLAVDVVPWPLDWNDRESFKQLSEVVFKKAAVLKLKIRWGGDFNMDGDKTTKDSWDMPHYELII